MLQISNLDGWVEGEGKFNYLICIRIVLQKYMYINFVCTLSNVIY